MKVAGVETSPLMQARLAADSSLMERGRALRRDPSSLSQTELREHVGEFVANIFYGTLFRQMQQSNLKGKYLHGGRGEEVFRGQLAMELTRRMGRAPNDPIAQRMYESFARQYGLGRIEPQGEDAEQADHRPGGVA